MPVETAERKVVADVVFGARSGGAEAQFTYAVAFHVEPGDLVLAPLSSRTLVGVVLRTFVADAASLGFPLEKLRPIDSAVRGVALPRAVLDMAQFVADSYLCPLPVAIGAGLPPGVGDRIQSTWTLRESELRGDFELTPAQAEWIEVARKSGGAFKLPKSMTPTQRRALVLLEAKGVLSRSTSIAREPAKSSGVLYRLVPDDERIEIFLREHAEKRPAQALALLKWRDSDAVALSHEDIRALCGVGQTAIKALQEARLIERVRSDPKAPRPVPTPNSDQAAAIGSIARAIAEKVSRGFLLFGVTGSGKTEVYLRAAVEALRLGRQVLYLVPEIALATQAIGLIRERFGTNVAVLHSELTPRERLDSWMRIRNGEAPIVIGARSALFAPLDNLGLIVMDEEHEGSYKQESSPRYHAKSLVRFLAERHGCPFILGSATPSIESYFEAQNGTLNFLELPSRTASARLPEVEIEDLGYGFRSGRPALLTERLEELLTQTKASGHQSILFLNRRAYAPFLVCRECGHFFMCPRCAVTLTYSRKSLRLRCHHCGHEASPPDACPTCQGNRIQPVGVGTEKVEEIVQALLPEARVERLDRDVAQKKGALESILARFGAGEIDVLVGTQIVAKGLNFPNVTLVGVIAADVSLNLPDFRASERTFQLLSQVAGRAGRGASPGRVVIQTFSPSHIAVQSAQSHNYRSFFDATIHERRDAGYPPFTTLVNIVFSGDEYAAVMQSSTRAVTELRRRLPDAEVLGPAQCVLERLHNRWRWHALVKGPVDMDLQQVEAALDAPRTSKVQVVVDVDPYSLM